MRWPWHVCARCAPSSVAGIRSGSSILHLLSSWRVSLLPLPPCAPAVSTPSPAANLSLPFPYLDARCYQDGACYPVFEAAGAGRARDVSQFVLVAEPSLGLSMIYTPEAVALMAGIGRVRQGWAADGVRPGCFVSAASFALGAATANAAAFATPCDRPSCRRLLMSRLGQAM